MINKIVNPLDLPISIDYKDEDTTVIVDSVTGELKQVLNKTIKNEGGASNFNDVLKGGNVAIDTQATNGIELQDNGENVKINNTSFLIERPAKGFETSINNSSLNIKDQTSELNVSNTGLSVTYNNVKELDIERSTISISNGAEKASLLPTGFDFSGTGNGTILFPTVESGDVKTFALNDEIPHTNTGEIKNIQLIDQNGGATYTYRQKGNYSKIYDRVFFDIWVSNIRTTGSPNGVFYITSETFTDFPCVQSKTSFTISLFVNGSVSFYSISGLFSQTGKMYFIIQDSLDGSMNKYLSANSFNNGEIVISGNYRTV